MRLGRLLELGWGHGLLRSSLLLLGLCHGGWGRHEG